MKTPKILVAVALCVTTFSFSSCTKENIDPNDPNGQNSSPSVSVWAQIGIPTKFGTIYVGGTYSNGGFSISLGMGQPSMGVYYPNGIPTTYYAQPAVLFINAPMGSSLSATLVGENGVPVVVADAVPAEIIRLSNTVDFSKHIIMVYVRPQIAATSDAGGRGFEVLSARVY